MNGNRNIAQWFVHNKALGYCLLMLVFAWGLMAYRGLPKRKDPELPVNTAVAITTWPGARADQVEKLVTQKIEDAVAGNVNVETVRSISRPNVSIVYIELRESIKESGKEFDDVKVKLDQVRNLPAGAGPIQYIKDFGDTAALMLTVASPKIDTSEVRLTVERAKKLVGDQTPLPATLWRMPRLDNLALAERVIQRYRPHAHVFSGDGMVGFTGNAGDLTSVTLALRELDADTWDAVTVNSARELTDALPKVAGDKYSFRQLDVYTEQIEKDLKCLPIVSKVARSGIQDEVIRAYYSQAKLVNTGISPQTLMKAVEAANSTIGGGELSGTKQVAPVHSEGSFQNFDDVGRVMVGAGAGGSPVRLGDVTTLSRGYSSPMRYVNNFTYPDKDGRWERSKAITLSIQMQSGAQISAFGSAVDAQLNQLRPLLPKDLILARTSDQAQQVEDNLIGLFVKSLGEAIVLVVLVSLVGFWDWRSALLMGLAIPITLALTFGMMLVTGLDLQQVSVATLIIALGLLVDVPVVAGDGIKRKLAQGHPIEDAAWMGPTHLIKVLAYATMTNIAAYLPFLMLSGNTGRYLHTLPLVITYSLLAALLVSMTFIPLIGRALYRNAKPIPQAKESAFQRFYHRLVERLIRYRWLTLTAAAIFFLLGATFFTQLHQQYFPHDLSYLSTIDVRLPSGASLADTDRTTKQVERITEETSREFNPKGGVLRWLTTFVGGGGPRFWFSVEPEIEQLNYAQVIVQTNDEHVTAPFLDLLQQKLDKSLVGARADVRMLETGKSVGVPVAIRISGPDGSRLRELAEKVKGIYRTSQIARGINDDWNESAPALVLKTDSAKANLSGLSEAEIAASSGIALSGTSMSALRHNEQQVSIEARLAPDERIQEQDTSNLYAFSAEDPHVRVPLSSVAQIETHVEPTNILRRNRYRTLTVGCFPVSGKLPSEVLDQVRPELDKFMGSLPTGYSAELAGEQHDQDEGFGELAVALAVSVLAIYMMLVLQLKHLAKPLVVFSAIPFGIAGAFIALWLSGQPFGFMAFTGVASLIGVIVSHIIVLIEFIEEGRAEGLPLEQALAEAGVQRLRPVIITVAATVLGLVPLAAHGGPLWEPLCYAQIGGLSMATLVTLLLTPTIYSVFVKDLKLIHWEK